MPGHHETERVTRRGQSFNTGISPVERNDSTGTDSMGVWQKLWESPARNQSSIPFSAGPLRERARARVGTRVRQPGRRTS